MRTKFKLLSGLAAVAVVAALPCAANALDWSCPEKDTVCIERMSAISECWETEGSFEERQKEVDQKTETSKKPEVIGPTFTTEDNGEQGWVRLGIGRNVLLAGNNLNSNVAAKNGLLFIMGNNLELNTEAEYGFVAGNKIAFSGATTRDLYIAGNHVEVGGPDTKIGRDLFVAANEVFVGNTDLPGDLAVTAEAIALQDIKISGNVNLAVSKIVFTGKVEIDGTFTYNDDAEIVGIENVTYGDSEAYHVQEVDERAVMVARIYNKVVSTIGLFIVMAVLCALRPCLHDKIERETTVGRFGTNLAMGLGVLIAVPIVTIFTFVTIIAAPLGIIAIVLYCLMIYLAQGLTGAWLGHVILEKLAKSKKNNIFIEALLGIVILAVVSMLPYIGALVGFLSMLLGMGMTVAFFRPLKKSEKAELEEETKK